MVDRREALIIATGGYDHDGLRDLRSATADATALAGVLRDPAIGDFAVDVLRDGSAHEVRSRIEDFFADRRPSDLLLLHLSCHGLKSESGDLYFTARDTRPQRLASTAISADFVQHCLRMSRSRSIVVLLDCCYGGAFAKGVRVRAAGDIPVMDSFPAGAAGSGRGRAVITASSAMEYAFEGDELADDNSPTPSIFTSALVDGLRTGDADLDGDGLISLDELYDYVFDRVRERNPAQTPTKNVEMTGDLFLARSRRGARLPAEMAAEQPEPTPAVVPTSRSAWRWQVFVAAVFALLSLSAGVHMLAFSPTSINYLGFMVLLYAGLRLIESLTTAVTASRRRWVSVLCGLGVLGGIWTILAPEPDPAVLFWLIAAVGEFFGRPLDRIRAVLAAAAAVPSFVIILSVSTKGLGPGAWQYFYLINGALPIALGLITLAPLLFRRLR